MNNIIDCTCSIRDDVIADQMLFFNEKNILWAQVSKFIIMYYTYTLLYAVSMYAWTYLQCMHMAHRMCVFTRLQYRINETRPICTEFLKKYICIIQKQWIYIRRVTKLVHTLVYEKDYLDFRFDGLKIKQTMEIVFLKILALNN